MNESLQQDQAGSLRQMALAASSDSGLHDGSVVKVSSKHGMTCPASDAPQAGRLRLRRKVEPAGPILPRESLQLPCVMHLDVSDRPGGEWLAWHLAIHLRLMGRGVGWLDLGDGVPELVRSVPGPVPVIKPGGSVQHGEQLSAAWVRCLPAESAIDAGRIWKDEQQPHPFRGVWLTMGEQPGQATAAYEALKVGGWSGIVDRIGVLLHGVRTIPAALRQFAMFRALCARESSVPVTLFGMIDFDPGMDAGHGPRKMLVHRQLHAAAAVMGSWSDASAGRAVEITKKPSFLSRPAARLRRLLPIEGLFKD